MAAAAAAAAVQKGEKGGKGRDRPKGEDGRTEASLRPPYVEHAELGSLPPPSSPSTPHCLLPARKVDLPVSSRHDNPTNCRPRPRAYSTEYVVDGASCKQHSYGDVEEEEAGPASPRDFSFPSSSFSFFTLAEMGGKD